MKVRLINSAMMPKTGSYKYKSIDSETFFQKIKDAHQTGILIHNIGYEQNLNLINRKTGLQLKTNRDKTTVENGDEILTMSLNYRTDGVKGKKVNERDFVYGLVEYDDGITIEQKRFVDAMKDGSKYSFETDTTTFENETIEWMEDIINLQSICKEKLGVGYQKKLADLMEVKPQTISRIFSLKFSPTYKVLFDILNAIGYTTVFQKSKNWIDDLPNDVGAEHMEGN